MTYGIREAQKRCSTLKPLSTSTGTRATFRHRERAEEALQYSSLIATEELSELLKPASTVPLYQYIPL